MIGSKTYNIVLDSLAKSGKEDSIDEIQSLLDKMIEIDVADRYV